MGPHQISGVGSQIAEHRRQIWRERQILGGCRQIINGIHAIHLHAVTRSDAAFAQAACLDLKLTRLTSFAKKSSATTDRNELVRMTAALDQADALAAEILKADAGPRFDTLAEVLGRIVNDLQNGVTRMLDEAHAVE